MRIQRGASVDPHQGPQKTAPESAFATSARGDVAGQSRRRDAHASRPLFFIPFGWTNKRSLWYACEATHATVEALEAVRIPGDDFALRQSPRADVRRRFQPVFCALVRDRPTATALDTHLRISGQHDLAGGIKGRNRCISLLGPR